MKGPRRIQDLDGVPHSQWRLDDRSMFMWRGKLWAKEAVGCVLCVEKEGPEFVTLSTTDDDGHEHFHCMTHQELVAVEFSVRKIYHLTIGSVVRDGEVVLSDVMLFPAAMALVTRNELIERLLDEAEHEEEAAGVT